MITVTPYQQKKARLRFIALYIVSVALIAIVFSAFWKTSISAVTPVANLNTLDENDFIRLDTLLHAKLTTLDNVYSDYLKTNNSNADSISFRLLSLKNKLAVTLDSIDKEAAILEDGPKKKAMLEVVETFKKSSAARDKLVGDIALLPKDFNATKKKTSPQNATAIPVADNKEIESLKASLQQKEQQLAAMEKNRLNEVEEKNKSIAVFTAQKQKDLEAKDRLIISLQSQLKQKPPPLAKQVPSTIIASATDAEWKQKNAVLKASFDKLAASEKSLRSAYKTVTDDNRRLLSQLQQSRKN